eukprot:TRINITY_DN91_c2_g2_i2.p1 TRINITY_DN91_c2_g2~~TRINITY_DN91_c2_g2_i2.p1  ORF type:complete len:1056 (-),score=405.09 TRINITY_DN91_c2_g2_i2:2423-5590(-)
MSDQTNSEKAKSIANQLIDEPNLDVADLLNGAVQDVLDEVKENIGSEDMDEYYDISADINSLMDRLFDKTIEDLTQNPDDDLSKKKLESDMNDLCELINDLEWLLKKNKKSKEDDDLSEESLDDKQATNEDSADNNTSEKQDKQHSDSEDSGKEGDKDGDDDDGDDVDDDDHDDNEEEKDKEKKVSPLKTSNVPKLNIMTSNSPTGGPLKTSSSVNGVGYTAASPSPNSKMAKSLTSSLLENVDDSLSQHKTGMSAVLEEIERLKYAQRVATLMLSSASKEKKDTEGKKKVKIDANSDTEQTPQKLEATPTASKPKASTDTTNTDKDDGEGEDDEAPKPLLNLKGSKPSAPQHPTKSPSNSLSGDSSEQLYTPRHQVSEKNPPLPSPEIFKTRDATNAANAANARGRRGGNGPNQAPLLLPQMREHEEPEDDEDDEDFRKQREEFAKLFGISIQQMIHEKEDNLFFETLAKLQSLGDKLKTSTESGSHATLFLHDSMKRVAEDMCLQTRTLADSINYSVEKQAACYTLADDLEDALEFYVQSSKDVYKFYKLTNKLDDPDLNEQLEKTHSEFASVLEEIDKAKEDNIKNRPETTPEPVEEDSAEPINDTDKTVDAVEEIRKDLEAEEDSLGNFAKARQQFAKEFELIIAKKFGSPEKSPATSSTTEEIPSIEDNPSIIEKPATVPTSTETEVNKPEIKPSDTSSEAPVSKPHPVNPPPIVVNRPESKSPIRLPLTRTNSAPVETSDHVKPPVNTAVASQEVLSKPEKVTHAEPPTGRRVLARQDTGIRQRSREVYNTSRPAGPNMNPNPTDIIQQVRKRAEQIAEMKQEEKRKAREAKEHERAAIKAILQKSRQEKKETLRIALEKLRSARKEIETRTRIDEEENDSKKKTEVSGLDGTVPIIPPSTSLNSNSNTSTSISAAPMINLKSSKDIDWSAVQKGLNTSDINSLFQTSSLPGKDMPPRMSKEDMESFKSFASDRILPSSLLDTSTPLLTTSLVTPSSNLLSGLANIESKFRQQIDSPALKELEMDIFQELRHHQIGSYHLLYLIHRHRC